MGRDGEVLWAFFMAIFGIAEWVMKMSFCYFGILAFRKFLGI